MLSPIAGAVLFASNVSSGAVSTTSDRRRPARSGKVSLRSCADAPKPNTKNANERSPFCLLVSNGDVLCRFSAAWNDGLSTHSSGRKAPRQEIAGWERRWCRNYGDFAAGAGVDVAERGGKARNVATRHGRELGCERVTDRLCNAILRFWVSPNGNIDVTTQGITLSAGSQHRH